jgi:hypothetical protein
VVEELRCGRFARFYKEKDSGMIFHVLHTFTTGPENQQ